MTNSFTQYFEVDKYKIAVLYIHGAMNTAIEGCVLPGCGSPKFTSFTETVRKWADIAVQRVQCQPQIKFGSRQRITEKGLRNGALKSVLGSWRYSARLDILFVAKPPTFPPNVRHELTT